MKKVLRQVLPFWNGLSDAEKEQLLFEAQIKSYAPSVIFHHSAGECAGVKIIHSGRARVFINSPDGREITLYRILDNDFCMMSAACMLNNINFGINLETETDCEIILLPRASYKRLLDTNAAVKNFTLDLVASKFSDVMWLLEQLVFSNMGRRLADALLELSTLSGSLTLNVTHEKIAADLGTAREVVTRLLRQFQLDGLVKLSRGKIEILDEAGLRSR